MQRIEADRRDRARGARAATIAVLGLPDVRLAEPPGDAFVLVPTDASHLMRVLDSFEVDIVLLDLDSAAVGLAPAIRARRDPPTVIGVTSRPTGGLATLVDACIDRTFATLDVSIEAAALALQCTPG